jgi:hypothetical protein
MGAWYFVCLALSLLYIYIIVSRPPFFSIWDYVHTGMALAFTSLIVFAVIKTFKKSAEEEQEEDDDDPLGIRDILERVRREREWKD